MKKTIAMLLVLAMLLALSAAAMADEPQASETPASQPQTLSYITALRGIEQNALEGGFCQVGALDLDLWVPELLEAQEDIPDDCYWVFEDENGSVSVTVRAVELEEGADLADVEESVLDAGAVSNGIQWINGFDALMYSVEEDDAVFAVIQPDDSETVEFVFQGISNPEFNSLASIIMCTIQPHALSAEDIALMMDADLNVLWGSTKDVTYALDGSSITVSLWHDGLNAANIRDLKNWDEVRDIVISTFNLYVRVLEKLGRNDILLTMQFTDDEEELSFLTIEGGEIVYDAFAA